MNEDKKNSMFGIVICSLYVFITLFAVYFEGVIQSNMTPAQLCEHFYGDSYSTRIPAHCLKYFEK